MRFGAVVITNPIVGYGLIGKGAFRKTSPSVFHPPAGILCVEGCGACGLACEGAACGAGVGVGGASAVTVWVALGAGCAAAGVSRRGLREGALPPRVALAARDRVGAWGAATAPSVRSAAETTSRR